MTKQLATNGTKGYGYNYTSLADFAKQGFNIPVMRTSNNEYGEYIEWYDKEKKEWFQGARVVDNIAMKGSNAAQIYGAALSYARRYTVAMALGLATTDDQQVEEPTMQTTPKKPKLTAKDKVKKRIAEACNNLKSNGAKNEAIQQWVKSVSDKPLNEMTIKEMEEVADLLESIANESK